MQVAPIAITEGCNIGVTTQEVLTGLPAGGEALAWFFSGHVGSLAKRE